MKFLLAPLLVITCSSLMPASAQDDRNAKLAPWQQDYLNLPQDRREEFKKHLSKASELFKQKRIFETIDELNAAENIFDDSPEVETLYGACQVEFRAFDKAMEHFERANALTPGNGSVLFNIGEVYFVQKRWDDAQKAFERVLLLLDADDQFAMTRLTQFKILLCMIKLGKPDEARKLVDKYDILDDSPYPYYAEAAMAYHDGDELKAEAALARAARIFRQEAILAPWKDTLMEFGYIKSFYGGDIEEP
ncbi:hypothetical protein HAHE_42890 [Haloferula helveola]|uniref:Tetratricopeptide repeat protein n=1 Tax=Haloferula helveola TaxID=490095 RepID=A0ABM7RJC3_9BACT|nr:hypothetical protein HAHE_42890 [Haloferula helveola]